MSLSRFFLVLLILLLAIPLAAQITTGTLSGAVKLGNGDPAPGITVTVTSPSLQGERITVTSGNGDYIVRGLPPGLYTVKFALEGFKTTSTKVTVPLGGNGIADATMNPSSIQEITVTAEAPVLDTSTSSLGTNLNARAIETLPTGRNYSSIVQVAPGVTSDANPQNTGQSTISVYGSSGAENSYFIDGVNTTNAEYGFQGKELNFEFIQEVDVKTGGYEAEFGKSTGGIINVITKSGGNDLRGDVFGYYDNDSLQSNTKSVVSNGGTAEGFTRKDYGVDLGGFFVKDKLWFFAAYDQVRNSLDSSLPSGPNAGDLVTSDSHRNLGSAKLTWNIATGHSLVGTFFQDPRVDTGAINDANHALNGDPATYLGRQDFGGRDYALSYDGGFASQWIFSGQIARHREKNSVGPATSAGDAIEYRDASNDFFQTGGFGLEQEKSFDRKLYGTSAEHFLGAHDIKAGFEYQTESADVTKQMSGGQQVDVFANDVNPLKPIYRHFYWTTPTATVANAPVGALIAKPQHKNTALFLQDRWTMRNVTINAGVRWDRQRIIDASGVTQIDLKKDYAPRLGFSWDPNGDHKSKVIGSYGRYYEEIPMDLVIRSFSYERQPRIVNYSPTSTTPDPNAEADYGTTSAILGGFTEPSDPDIRNQYLSEYIIGGEREVMPNISVGVKGIYRSYGRVIEDFLCADDGTYCIGNPGQGLMKDIFTLDYSHTLPAPKPKRTYKGLQFDATKRFSNNWQAIASYIYSKLDGNYDGEWAPFTNVGADPNISAAYDYYDFFTNGSDLSKITNKGPLSNDRRNQFKVSGSYFTPWKLSIGASAYWRSGTPLTRYGYSDAYGRYEFFLTTRGAEGRTPDNYEADVHLGYPIDTGRFKVNLLLDIFNVLNAQRPILLDQRWGFEEADNASPTPVNPNYLKPVLRTPPTSARFGVRVSF
ncbi:MAG TPA: TonB-dependent receptor [Thermoanaerobaculia bacterium]|nr:TonB-dependent receptor [Thermoanaerobaculia bacterium]